LSEGKITEIMELEPKHLTPYLPYSLKVLMEGKKCNVAWMSTKNIAVIRPDGIGEYKKIAWKHAHWNIKPILKPLSYLTKEIEHEGKRFVPIERLQSIFTTRLRFDENGFYYHIDKSAVRGKAHDESFPFNQLDAYSYLFKWKLDIFNLIEKGLALEEKVKEKAD